MRHWNRLADQHLWPSIGLSFGVGGGIPGQMTFRKHRNGRFSASVSCRFCPSWSGSCGSGQPPLNSMPLSPVLSMKTDPAVRLLFWNVQPRTTSGISVTLPSWNAWHTGLYAVVFQSDIPYVSRENVSYQVFPGLCAAFQSVACRAPERFNSTDTRFHPARNRAKLSTKRAPSDRMTCQHWSLPAGPEESQCSTGRRSLPLVGSKSPLACKRKVYASNLRQHGLCSGRHLSAKINTCMVADVECRWVA